MLEDLPFWGGHWHARWARWLVIIELVVTHLRLWFQGVYWRWDVFFTYGLFSGGIHCLNMLLHNLHYLPLRGSWIRSWVICCTRCCSSLLLFFFRFLFLSLFVLVTIGVRARAEPSLTIEGRDLCRWRGEMLKMKLWWCRVGKIIIVNFYVFLSVFGFVFCFDWL